MWSRFSAHFQPFFSVHGAYFSRLKILYFNVLQKKNYFKILHQNRVVFDCFATKWFWVIVVTRNATFSSIFLARNTNHLTRNTFLVLSSPRDEDWDSEPEKTIESQELPEKEPFRAREPEGASESQKVSQSDPERAKAIFKSKSLCQISLSSLCLAWLSLVCPLILPDRAPSGPLACPLALSLAPYGPL